MSEQTGDCPEIRKLADDVRAKMLAKATWLAQADGEVVVRITPTKESGSYRIRLEAKA